MRRVLAALLALALLGTNTAAGNGDYGNATGNGAANTVKLLPNGVYSPGDTGSINITGTYTGASTTTTSTSNACAMITTGGALTGTGSGCDNYFFSGAHATRNMVTGVLTNALFTCSAGSQCALGTISFPITFTVSPYCVLTPTGITAGSTSFYPYSYTRGTTTFSVHAIALAAIVATAVSIFYVCWGD